MKRSHSYKFRSEKKKSKGLPILLSIIGVLLIGSVATWLGLNNWDVDKSYQRIVNLINEKNEQPNPIVGEEEPFLPVEDEEIVEEEPTPEEAIQYIEGQELPTEPTYIDGVLIANKKHPLPSTFAPGESEEARAAFEEMAAAALLEEYSLTAFSTYRSFDYQTELYNRYVERDGVEEADRYSARPGYSEHQTGLAFDIGEVNQEQHFASSSFGDTEAGKWLAENAHLYGFIMRYPEGKESITGYMYEAWHYRYVGIEMAKDIYENQGTLEEYLGV